MADRLAGVLCHPTSFPSPYGIGDLGPGAYKFIDFLEEAGLNLWQILPLGPTSFGDSPYQSFSSFAGNPLLISPDILLKYGLLDDSQIEPNDFDPRKIDYGKVIKYKEGILKNAYTNFKMAPLWEKALFQLYKKRNSQWLLDYALFCAIKEDLIEKRAESELPEGFSADCYYGASFFTWPEDIMKRRPNAMKEYMTALAAKIDYHQFLQYLFYRQWKALKAYANGKNITIIGDMPIFASLDSADVWAAPHLFDLDEKLMPKTVAGVPPDYFSETGQLWGNPLYNWNAHQNERYNWWKQRLEILGKQCDIIRIDHFRGFEAYWQIPAEEETAIGGRWVKGPGEDFFNELYNYYGSLPFIAEDLGLITPEVLKLRDRFNLPGMSVLQFAFDSDSTNSYLPHSLKNENIAVYTGTHDNNTSLGWYKNAPPKTTDLFRRYINVDGSNVSWDMIRLAYSTVAKYAIFPVQDLLSLDENHRMNTPGNPRGNWSFRYEENDLTNKIAENITYLNTLFNRGITKH